MTEIEREHKQGNLERKKPHMGLNPRTLGSCPKLSHPGVPRFCLF